MKTELIEKAKAYGIKCHFDVNQKYDGDKPYSHHLEMVYEYAKKYSYLLTDEYSIELAFASAWTHDVIEDARQTYNDVVKELGVDIAEITYALTTEKGKNRQERANSAYYAGIRQIKCAVFIKICDRLANVSYSKKTDSRMLEVYSKEHEHFYNELYSVDFNDMWAEMRDLLNLY